MNDFKILPIDALSIHKVLASSELTDKQKAEFIKKNEKSIHETMKVEITKSEFAEIMKNRPLIRFRPLKNSFTKQGDKILLAQALGIEKAEVNKYISECISCNFNGIQPENTEKIKTYVYRHGSKDEVIRVLENELSNVKGLLERLYKTLEDNSGGLADYFSRPIHRMDNITLGKLYNTIDKSLRNGVDAGFISKEDCNSTSEWALVRIYQIQNNSKVIRALEAYKDLTGL